MAGVDQALTATETAVITFNSADGSFYIYTTDKTLHSQVWTLKVFKRSTYAAQPGQDGVYEFDITFKDECEVAVLSAAIFSESTYTFDLGEAELITASPM